MRQGIYPRGEVLFAEIQFSGSVGYKRRPVIVLSTEGFQAAGSKLIVAGITSNLDPPLRPGEVTIIDWNEAGLVKPSAVRGLISTLDSNEIVRRLGRLSEADLARVEQAVAGIMGFALLKH